MRPARLALLTAALLCCASLIGNTARAVGAATVWSDLWRTPDQQGQALLQAGKPAQAAARFQDPRRRAYADIESGHYRQAAQLLAPFGDPRSQYNRGNALARAGRLRAALAAYDAALKQAPDNRDIRHNRDLVARALQQQSRSAQSSSGAGKAGQGQPSGGQRQSSTGQRQGQSGSRSPQSGAHGPQSAGQSRTAGNGSQSPAGQSGHAGAQQPHAPQVAGDQGSGSPKESPGQAKRDAAFAAAVARGQHPGSRQGGQPPAAQQNGAGGSGAPGTGKAPNQSALVAGGTRTPPQKPESERQLALDQWLRQIPDSPAGLLRRKFLIEHMLRQQNDDASQESSP
jgi:Ca-activated chloride channel family protein